MAVETSFPLAATWPAGGDYAEAREATYDAIQLAAGLTFLQAAAQVQFYLRARAPGGQVPAAAAGDLVIITPAGIPALPASIQAELATFTGSPLPVRDNPSITRAKFRPGGPGRSPGRTTRIFNFPGPQLGLTYWDGVNWRRASNDVIVATPAEIPGQNGELPPIP